MTKLGSIFSSRSRSQYITSVAIALLALAAAITSGCGGGSSSSTADTIAPTFTGAKGYTALASSVTLSWSPASDNVTAAQNIVYQIYRSTTAGGENYATPTITTAPGALSYDDTGLTVGTTYYYVVRAMDLAGNMDSNIVEKMASTDITPPAFPLSGSGISATANPDVSITVSWYAATDNITLQSSIVYLVYRSTTSGFIPSSSTLIATTAAGVVSYKDAGLTPLTTYYYVVRAQDQSGNVDANTTQVFATTPADTTAPTFAGATGAAAQSYSSMLVSWNAATDNVTSSANMVYLVYRSATTTMNYSTPIATTAAGATSYFDSGLTASTTYYYVVRAKDQAGNTDTNTVQVTATTSAFVADTTAPTFAGASSLTVQPAASMTVNWSAASDNVTAPSGIVYLVYRSTTSTMSYVTPFATTAAGATSYVDNTATGTKYYYVVRAKDAAGNIDTNTVQVFGPVSFLSDIYNPLMTTGTASTCLSAGCHTAVSSAGSLDLSTVSKAYINLVNVTSGECASQKFVAPGSSATSYLYIKLSSSSFTCGSGSQMPKTGTKLTTTQLNTVKAWIDQGAPNN